MSSEERQQILKMVEEGKISADEAVQLMKVLDESSVETEIVEAPSSRLGTGVPAPASGPEAGSDSQRPRQPELEEVADRARRLWRIPLWIGVGLTILSAYWLYALFRVSDFGFRFYCAWVPFLFGIVVLAVSAASRTSHWLLLQAESAPGERWPHNITLGFPLPLGLAVWLLRHFGHYVHGFGDARVDEMVDALAQGVSLREPLIVSVDDHEHAARVSLYIG